MKKRLDLFFTRLKAWLKRYIVVIVVIMISFLFKDLFFKDLFFFFYPILQSGWDFNVSYLVAIPAINVTMYSRKDQIKYLEDRL